MTRAREHIVSKDITPYYHIISRCVRRTFLCGYDKDSKRDYEYRRQWIVDRIRLLSSVFTIDICSYAVMSNHYHMTVKLCPEQAKDWTEKEVADRWCTLHTGPLLLQRWRAGDTLTPAELSAVSDILIAYRKRLQSLSWFMRLLNEPIARQANKEDKCSGHFWQARFTSKAILDETALLTCMTYVDLNPIRAKLAQTPETSDYTSIKERITPQFDLNAAVTNQQAQQQLNDFDLKLKPLALFDGHETIERQSGIPFRLDDYLELVDWTGRIVRADKRGAIAEHLPPILKRLNVEADTWLTQATTFEAVYNKDFRRRSSA